ncbi:hypothetical protein [Nonomuraea sp. B5E05]|uniref:hypothetical protein n=1 Tax=Nonomuraea sp. B5E05 TaxID=3153569 RepID=UPI0032603AA1
MIVGLSGCHHHATAEPEGRTWSFTIATSSCRRTRATIAGLSCRRPRNTTTGALSC